MVKKYEKYKDSGVEWIRNIPEHWELRKLKHSAKINLSNVDKKTLGGQVKVKLCNYVDVYKNSKITSKIEFMEATATKEQKEKFILQEGDVIITKDSESPEDIAVPAYVLESMDDVVCGYHLAHIKPKIITGLFLYYSFLTEKLKDQFCISANGITRYGLGKDSIGGSIFFVPPLLEQQKIASYLDKKSEAIDRFINNKEELINLLEEEKKAIITKALTKGLDKNVKLKDSGADWLGEIPEHWGVRRLKYLFKIRKRIAGELGYDVLSITQRGIKIKDITSNEGQLSMDYRKYQIVEIGDFAMNHMDLLTGYVDISKFDGVTSPDYRVFSVTDKNSYDRYYLYLLQLCYFSRVFFAFGQGSSELGRWRFPADQFNVFLFPYPDKEQQQAIVAHLDEETKKIDDLKAKYRQEIDLIKEYKERLIYDVVTGKMCVLEH
jgi:type I restriction enzyme, S subunit